MFPRRRRFYVNVDLDMGLQLDFAVIIYSEQYFFFVPSGNLQGEL